MEEYSLHKLRHRFNQQTKIDDLNKLVKDLKKNPINKDVLIEQLFTFIPILFGNSDKSIFNACYDIINVFHSTTLEKLSKHDIGVEIEEDTLNEFKIESKSILLAFQCQRLINFYLYKSKEPIYIKFLDNNVYTDFVIISNKLKETNLKKLIIFVTDPKHKNYNEVLDFLLAHYKKEKFLSSKDILINEISSYLEELKKTPHVKPVKNIISTDSFLFVIGLNFANGKIYDLQKKGLSNPKITNSIFPDEEEINQINNICQHIKCTITNYQKGNANYSKNIYSKIELIDFIYKFCIKEKIKIHDTFLDEYNKLSLKV
jgi:hypothetical protein